ncbi:hypothetical protein ACFB49_45470 [Sphingomonas sp. DBB INV C78]|uniref:PAS domain S-box protein n=1 Tax=Sphingomonas sp. DBB INV C78 TaxID=3349434 RepID=UPI0036D3E26B
MDSDVGQWPGWTPYGCIGLAFFICVLVLFGWGLGNLTVAGFGSSIYVMQPLTAVSYIFIALALLASIRQQSGLVILLAVPALGIAGSALLQYVTGLELGVDRLLFGDKVVGLPRLNPGRPGPMPTATILLLGTAALLSVKAGHRRSQIIVLIASLTFGISIIAGMALPLGVVGHMPHTRSVMVSVPTCITTLALAAVLIAWRHQSGWPGLLSARGVEGRTLRTVFVLVLLAPALMALASLWALTLPGSTPAVVEMAEAGAFIVLATGILFWAWTRIARENGERWAVTRALDSAPIVLTNEAGTILHWSKGAERLYQWTAEEAIGRNKHELLVARGADHLADVVGCLNSGEAREKEIVEYRRDGSELHVLEQARLLPIRSQDAPLIVLSMTDVTEREQRAAVLAARESEIRSILEASPDGILTIDADGRIRSFNPTAERLFGYAAKDVLGHDRRMLLPVRFRTDFDADFSRLIADKAHPGPTLQHIIGLRSDGSEFPVELAMGTAQLGDERIFTIFIRDVTEKIAAQDRQTELREELLHVSRLSAMGEMAAGLAHELNQPLAAATNFLGAVEMLLAADEASSPRVRELVGLASSQTLRAGDIIQRLRAFVSKGEVDVRAEPIADIMADAIGLALTSMEQQRVDIRYDLDAARPVILADRVQIQQVLVNLIRNAIDAQEDQVGVHPEILLISRGATDGMIEISVCDNGPGIAPEILQRPYEPFMSTKAGGMGIGLSICRRIVEFHGGQLRAENRAEGGACVRFTVPAFQQNAELAA